VTCRICRAGTEPFLDLGASPPANSLKRSPLDEEQAYPLVLEWCQVCGNIQLRDTLAPDDLYTKYLYVTPTSSALSRHYENLVAFLAQSGYLTASSSVVEIGSNVGHFLAHLEPQVRRVLGVDPAQEIASDATRHGIPTVPDFFTAELARELRATHGPADVVVARHCLAHNPDPHVMVAGARALLASDGFLVIENAYVVDTVVNTEFDQVYHEHMFYFSIRSIRRLLSQHGLHLIDAMLAPVHGGSIVFVASPHRTLPSAQLQMIERRESEVLTPAGLDSFSRRAWAVRDALRDLVASLKAGSGTIHTYGASAKGNTLLNFVGLSSSQIDYCVDSTPAKIGMFLPGSNVEVISEESGHRNPPDHYLLTAWNYEREIVEKVRRSGNRKSRFIVPIPEVRISSS